ncbi:GNAT family N-acetyltransferase [Paenibacillus beijingensis]|uniref:GNAT family acetyltraansferase n=1 Tax=Paenibacillus beijingensis TaxID=1126833 RepID=A0A0D5NJV6_9BACL|nr:GNAT family N-acetyltransferase [Paenibacillus beijingensis]AJY75203.1 GNAT family acetyltraansferase [Paenibacillus beijingensis]
MEEPVKVDNGYIIRDGNETVAEITYVREGEGTLVIDHTYVTPELRGGKVADKLLGLVVQEARDTGKKIVPACAYVLARFKRDKGFADVWQR